MSLFYALYVPARDFPLQDPCRGQSCAGADMADR